MGRAAGLRADVFAKLGDSNTRTPNFLVGLGSPATPLAEFDAEEQATVARFRAPADGAGANSFNRTSLAAYPGWTTREVRANVDAELDATHASVAMITVGTNDTGLFSQADYAARLGELLDHLTARGVVPLVTTLPPLQYVENPEGTRVTGEAFDQAVVDVAQERRLPVVNLWKALRGLPNNGLDPFGVHLNVSPNGVAALAPVDRGFGSNERNYVTVQALTALRTRVLDVPTDVPPAAHWDGIRPGEGVAAAGSAPGLPATVALFDTLTGKELARVVPFGAGFRGGVSVAVGDLDGDGVQDVIVGAGVGGGPAVLGYSGVDGHALFALYAFEPAFRGGVNVALGDLDGDGLPELVVGVKSGGGPRVQVIDPRTQAVRADFFAFEPTFTGGVTVAAGSPGVAVGAGRGGAPLVALFDVTGQPLRQFAAYDTALRGGVNVAVGDLGGPAIVTAPLDGGSPNVRVFAADTLENLAGFFAGDPAGGGGAAVAVDSLTHRIVAAPGFETASPIRVYDPAGNQTGTLGGDALALAGASVGG